MTNYFRWLPSVEYLLGNEKTKENSRFAHEEKTEVARKEVALWREKIKNNSKSIADTYENEEAFKDAVLQGFLHRLNNYVGLNIKKVVNGTGIVLHTNLGRAPLPQKAIEAVNNVITGYCNLELDLETGERSKSRFANVRDIICKLTGAEDCLVVNNNAAAFLLALNTFGEDKEGIISRGQLVEIGGGFRVPEIMEKSGVVLKEIGTTNKTRIEDYEKAISEETGVLLVIHPSNFHMTGFVETPELTQVADLGKEKGITTIYDWGCGALYPLVSIGIGKEATINRILSSGIDIVTFSGDKLLGGPQCGIILGKKEKIKKMYDNPLTRALRPDKMVLAALEGTLRYYANMEKAVKEVPTLRNLTKSQSELQSVAEELIEKLENVWDDGEISLEYTKGLVGGGTLPDVKLATCVVKIEGVDDLEALTSGLRSAAVPVVGYIHGGAFNIDVRTLLDGDVDWIVKAFAGLTNKQ